MRQKEVIQVAVVVHLHGDYPRAVKKAGLKPKDQLEVLDSVSRWPHLGTPISGAGVLRKLRVKFISRRIGKRGGLRVIYYYDEQNQEAWLLDVFYKGDKTELAPTEVQRLERLAKSL